MYEERFISGFLKRAEEEGMDKQAFLLPLLTSIGSMVGGAVGADALGAALLNRGLKRKAIQGLIPTVEDVENPAAFQMKVHNRDKAMAMGGIHADSPVMKPDFGDWLGQQHQSHPSIAGNIGGMVMPMVTDPIVEKMLQNKAPQQPRYLQPPTQYQTGTSSDGLDYDQLSARSQNGF